MLDDNLNLQKNKLLQIVNNLYSKRSRSSFPCYAKFKIQSLHDHVIFYFGKLKKKKKIKECAKSCLEFIFEFKTFICCG